MKKTSSVGDRLLRQLHRVNNITILCVLCYCAARLGTTATSFKCSRPPKRVKNSIAKRSRCQGKKSWSAAKKIIVVLLHHYKSNQSINPRIYYSTHHFYSLLLHLVKKSSDTKSSLCLVHMLMQNLDLFVITFLKCVQLSSWWWVAVTSQLESEEETRWIRQSQHRYVAVTVFILLRLLSSVFVVVASCRTEQHSRWVMQLRQEQPFKIPITTSPHQARTLLFNFFLHVHCTTMPTFHSN